MFEYVTKTNIKIILTIIGIGGCYLVYKYAEWLLNWMKDKDCTTKNTNEKSTMQLIFMVIILIILIILVIGILYIVSEYSDQHHNDVKDWIYKKTDTPINFLEKFF